MAYNEINPHLERMRQKVYVRELARLAQVERPEYIQEHTFVSVIQSSAWIVADKYMTKIRRRRSYGTQK
tara:strand:- start:52 stop:258 length:207 start_codon:yes stop_codon:yes gene_type:complete